MTDADEQSGGDDTLQRRFAELQSKYQRALEEIETLQRDSEAMHSIGIYQYMHPLQNAVAYQDALAEIRSEIKKHVLAGSAIESSTRFAFDNSLAKGRKMTADLAKIMLRREAYSDAAATDLAVVRQWPDTPWAPDAALDLARAMVGMKESREACGVLTEIDSHYPKASAQVHTGADQVRSEAGCAAG